jgi:small subunit ribosomal protein S9
MTSARSAELEAVLRGIADGFDDLHARLHADLDALYARVTDAILNAEELDNARDADAARAAWGRVAVLEGLVALTIDDPADFEAEVAFRGTVEAALKAGALDAASAVLRLARTAPDLHSQVHEEMHRKLMRETRESRLGDKAAWGRYAVGRRKSARANVRIKPGSGALVVNDRTAGIEYFTDAQLHEALSPLKVLDLHDVDVAARVRGGGKSGQAGALKLGLARALIAADPARRPALKAAGMLIRDPREVERKKAGLKKARKAPQYSKR